MGMYSITSDFGARNEAMIAAKGYHGATGAARILIECCQEDMKMFNTLIADDFREAYETLDGGEVINESAVVDKMKKFFVWLREKFVELGKKIAGIFKSFTTQFMGVFIKDNKELVKKLKEKVAKNLRDKKLEKMEYSIHENIENGFFEEISGTVNKLKADTIFSELSKKIMTEQIHRSRSAKEIVDKLREEKFTDDTALIDSYEKLGVHLGSVSEFRDKFTDLLLGEKTDVTGYTKDFNSFVEASLTEGSKTLTNLKKVQETLEKQCKKNIELCKKLESEISKLDSKTTAVLIKKDNGNIGAIDKKKGNENTTVAAQAIIPLLSDAAKADQTLTTNITSVSISVVKQALKELRSVYIKAASFRGVSEDAVLFDLIDEATSYEVDEMLEAEGYVSVPDEEVESTINQDVADVADEEESI